MFIVTNTAPIFLAPQKATYHGGTFVAQIVTFGQLGAKTVIRDIARVLEIPLSKSGEFCKMIPEDPKITLAKARELGIEEAYLSVHKTNPASLAVQQHCGARIDHEDKTEYYTRIATCMESDGLYARGD